MLDGDTVPTTSEVPAEVQAQSAFAALRAETEPATPEADAAPTTTEEAPEPIETEPVKERVLFKIGEEEVDEDTLLEWKKSGLRQADYTRKSMENSAKDTQRDKERAEERKQTLAKWEQLQAAVESLSPKEPDWNGLRAQVQSGALNQADLDRFSSQWLADKQQRDLITAETAKAADAVKADRVKESESVAHRNYERVLEIIPEWKDIPTRQKDFQEIVAYASELGVDENVLMALPPEGFKMARDATAYHKLQQSTAKPKIVKVDSQSLKPGTVTSQPKTTGIDSAVRRLAQTTRDEDGVAAFRELRKAGLYTP